MKRRIKKFLLGLVLGFATPVLAVGPVPFGGIRLGSGSAGTPSLGFSADTGADTGIFRSAEDTVAVSTGGSTRLAITSSVISFSLVPVPSTDDFYDFGISSLRWQDGFFAGDLLLDNQGELRLGEPDADGTNYVSLKSPTLAANVNYTLPSDDGDAGEQLQTDGSGVLTWEAASAAGGDSITVNSSAATDANLLDGDIDWTLDTGTTPDNITATVACTGCIDITDMASDSVGEPELKAVDAAVDEECLTYETTTGDFEWQTCGSGGTGKPWEKFTAPQAFLPAASFATQDTRNTHPVLDFDAAADECAYFGGYLNSTYAGGGLNVVLAWMATSATTGATGWLVSIEAHPDDALDLDADSFVADNSSSATTASASGEVQYTTISFTDGADMDSLAAGESYRLRVCRDGDGSVVTDDMTGDAELYKVLVLEP